MSQEDIGRILVRNQTGNTKPLSQPQISRLLDQLVGLLDSLFTSVGFAERPLGHRNKSLLAAGDITADELRALVVGDIGGVLIERPGLDKNGRKQVAELNAMWTGITLKDIIRIAKAGQASDRPGVIIVSIGLEKAEILAEIIRRGLVNELIIDEDLAFALNLREARRQHAGWWTDQPWRSRYLATTITRRCSEVVEPLSVGVSRPPLTRGR
jgi:DNA-binding transcriptional regulator LsrR (DeoR family)